MNVTLEPLGPCARHVGRPDGALAPPTPQLTLHQPPLTYGRRPRRRTARVTTPHCLAFPAATRPTRRPPTRAGRPVGGPQAVSFEVAALPARPSSQTGHRGADGQVRCRRGRGVRQTCARGRTEPGRRLRG